MQQPIARIKGYAVITLRSDHDAEIESYLQEIYQAVSELEKVLDILTKHHSYQKIIAADEARFLRINADQSEADVKQATLDALLPKLPNVERSVRE